MTNMTNQSNFTTNPVDLPSRAREIAQALRANESQIADLLNEVNILREQSRNLEREQEEIARKLAPKTTVIPPATSTPRTRVTTGDLINLLNEAKTDDELFVRICKAIAKAQKKIKKLNEKENLTAANQAQFVRSKETIRKASESNETPYEVWKLRESDATREQLLGRFQRPLEAVKFASRWIRANNSLGVDVYCRGQVISWDV